MKNLRTFIIIVGILVAGLAIKVSAQDVKIKEKSKADMHHKDTHKSKRDKIKTKGSHFDHKDKAKHEAKEKDKRKEKDLKQGESDDHSNH